MDDFAAAIEAAQRDVGGKGIGTLGEKTLHLTLKYYFAPDSSTHEQPLGGFIADAVTEDGVIEVQTRGLSKLRPKLEAFLPLCPVTVVHPVRLQTRIVKLSPKGEMLSARRSPKHLDVFHELREIYALREHLQNDRLTLCLCAVHVTEFRVQTAKRKWNKIDIVPDEMTGLWNLTCAADYAAMLPPGLPRELTAAELATHLNCSADAARLALRILEVVGAAECCGMRGRSKLWSVTDAIGG